MEENGSICTGRTSCASFGIIVCLLFIAIFFNYVLRCIHSSRPSDPPSSLPLSTVAAAPPPPPAAVFDQNRLIYRHALKSIPDTNYEPKSSSSSGFESESESESCAVCLGEFEEGEKVRVLPKCKHVYHKECIDRWLLRSLHCPVCRERVVDPHDHLLLAKIHDDDEDNHTNHHNFSTAFLVF